MREKRVHKKVYYERDKNSAHKDSNYEKSTYENLDSLIVDLKKKLDSIRNECQNFLPDALTLDYIPYDKQLYRQMLGITVEKEHEINHRKYGNYYKREIELSVPIFDDVEGDKFLKEEESANLSVVFKAGINFLEGLQERQDTAIKLNLSNDLDMWSRMNQKVYNFCLELQKNGFMDEYGVLNF